MREDAVHDCEFEKLFWVLQPQLMRYALMRLDHSTAEDVVSSTFVTLLDKGVAFPATEGEERRLRGLAFEVLSGHVRNEYRSRKRRHALADRIKFLGARHDAAPDVADDLAEQRAIDHWLGQLSVDDQQVILLFNAGLDGAEMALALGCTPAAAAKRRSRARDRLRTIVMRDGALQ